MGLCRISEEIDSDIDMSRRPEVKKYMEERYGEDQVCSVGTYTTLQIKAALKDFGKVLGVPASDIAILTNSLGMDARSLEDLMKAGCQRRDIGKFIEKYPELVMIAGLVNGQPKAKSIHACAMMIYPKEKDMFHWSPIRQQDDMYISEWEGGELDSAGFLKEDILGILQLTKFSDILRLIKEHRGEEVDIYNVPLNDRTVFKYFQKGWNGDVFHFGAKGLTGYCKLLKPDNIDELINCIGLFRPGVMESGFHNKYVARKFGQEDVEIRIGEEDVLKRTRGIMIWQEQTMQLFSKLGGFDMVTADTCRRAIGKKQLEKIVPFKKDFKENYEKEYGVDEKYAEETWQEIEYMASYQFNHCIRGSERIKRITKNPNFSPTIEEMYLIKNNSQYAKETGHKPLHQMYKYTGYRNSWSLNEEGRLTPNKIVDIRYQGVRDVYRVTVSSGKTIDVTLNHKFKTQRGELRLEDIVVGDKIPVCIGYEIEDTGYRFTDKGKLSRFHTQNEEYREEFVLNSEKGHSGFVKKQETQQLKLRYYTKNLKKDFCEVCGKKDCRLEVHHIDNCHGNNDISNLQTVCSSCHKKLHYEIGRAKQGDKGLLVEWQEITSIEYAGKDNVYDIEMADPYHTFTIDNGIVTCNSHAAAYATTGYTCQWLKVHYPLEYWAVAFSYADDEDYPLYLHEINESGEIKMLPPDINNSGMTIVADKGDNGLLWSLASIKQVGEKAQQQIMEDREKFGQYFSLSDFLERLVVKGSAVNKSVVENLILSGAFDSIENIAEPKDRLKLIDQYRIDKGVKVDRAKDIFHLNETKTSYNWWYLLRQKRLCGFAFFDYKELYENYFKEQLDNPYFNYVEVEDIDEEDCMNHEKVIVGGYVYSKEIKSGKKGEYCILVLEQNYRFITVMFWSEEYESFERILGECDKQILFMNGVENWDERNSMPVIYATEATEVLVLT